MSRSVQGKAVSGTRKTVDLSLSGERVKRVLEQVVKECGERPDAIVLDNVLNARSNLRVGTRSGTAARGAVWPADKAFERKYPVASTKQRVPAQHNEHKVSDAFAAAFTVLETA